MKKRKQTPSSKNKKSSQTRPKNLGWVALFVAFLVILSCLVLINRNKSVDRLFVLIKANTDRTYWNIFAETAVWTSQMGTGIALHENGYDFSVSSQAMPSMYFTSYSGSFDPERKAAASPEDAHEIISDELTKAGFKIDPSNKVLPGVIYGRDKTTCLEMFNTTEQSLTLSCYDRSMIQQASTRYKPFVDAYNAANSSSPINTNSMIGPVVVKSRNGAGVIGSSRVAGYDIAEAVVTVSGQQKKLVLYYNWQNGPWKFVATATDEYGFRCGDFKNSAEIRNAFYDQVCLSENGHVKLDTNNRALQ